MNKITPQEMISYLETARYSRIDADEYAEIADAIIKFIEEHSKEMANDRT